MGRLTLSGYQSRLTTASQRGSVLPTLQADLVNEAIRELIGHFKFPELEGLFTFNTVIGTASYAIGTGLAINLSDFRALHEDGLRRTSPDEDKGKLIKESRHVYQKKIDLLNSSARGVPKYYHRYGRSVYLRPVPDAVYPIQGHYWKALTPLAAPTDTSPIDEIWDEVIYLGALYRLFRDYGEGNRYMLVYNNYLTLLRSRSLETDIEEFPEGSFDPVSPSDTEGVLEL